jgi:hypothetical protein
MVGALGSPALTPPRGATVDVCYVEGACSRISVSTSRMACRRHFLMLMVAAPESLALAPPGGPPSMFLSVDGWRSLISTSGTSQGSTVDVCYIYGGRSWISISTS